MFSTCIVLIVISIISGYADPEYVATGNISEKADVYGFGIVLFEIISGRLIHSYMKAEGTRKLPPPSYVSICFIFKQACLQYYLNLQHSVNDKWHSLLWQ